MRDLESAPEGVNKPVVARNERHTLPDLNGEYLCALTRVGQGGTEKGYEDDRCAARGRASAAYDSVAGASILGHDRWANIQQDTLIERGIE